MRCPTNHKCGNSTIFDEVATFHSALVDPRSGCFCRCRIREFAFGLQPIVKFFACLAATREIDFIRIDADFFPTVFGFCGRILRYMTRERLIPLALGLQMSYRVLSFRLESLSIPLLFPHELVASSLNARPELPVSCPLITRTAEKLLAREVTRPTSQNLLPKYPAGVALQDVMQFPPPVEHATFHRIDREPHHSSRLFCG